MFARLLVVAALLTTGFPAMAQTGLAPTTTALVSSADPIVYGNPVTFTATVTSDDGTPGGSLDFYVGADVAKTVTLSQGKASFATSLPGGRYQVAAVYRGDDGVHETSSASLTQHIDPAPVSVTFAISDTSIIYGDEVTISASVASSVGTPQGDMAFRSFYTVPPADGPYNFTDTVPLTNGHATLSTTSIPVGVHSVFVSYNGSSNFQQGGATGYTMTVEGIPTSTSLSTSVATARFGQKVTFTATVTNTRGVSFENGDPVAFRDGTTILGNGSLLNGIATFETSSLAVGTHTITAIYRKTDTKATSISNVVTQTVEKAASQVTLKPVQTYSYLDHEVTFEANVSVLAPGSSAPKGRLTFKDGAAVLGVVPDAYYYAMLKTSSLGVGDHVITVEYAGNDQVAASSASIPFHMEAAYTNTDVSGGAAESRVGEPAVFTALLSAYGGGAATGDVRFRDGGVNIGSAQLADLRLSGTVIAAGGTHACAMAIDGPAMCWGANGFGQLATASSAPNLFEPASVFRGGGYSGPLYGMTSISAGRGHTCGVMLDRTVKCWGDNARGQLGYYDPVTQKLPVDVTGMSDAAAVSAGGAHTCALTADGAVLCWGDNSVGQLGSAGPDHAYIPVQALTGAKALSLGLSHSCAVTDAGGVACWGDNAFGQLGDGTRTGRSTPVAVAGLSDIVGVAAGGYHTCALTSGGKVFCWGRNDHGQLGLGSVSQFVTAPAATALAGGIAALAAGTNHSCALTIDGGLKCWGDNSTGAIGDGTQIERHAPTDVVGLASGVTSFAAGNGITCAAANSGKVKCWGDDSGGQVGDGTGGAGQLRSMPADVVRLSTRAFAKALFSTSGLDSGVHTITASYEGDAKHLPSDSSELTQTVTQSATSTALTSSQNPAVVGQPVTFTATVSPVPPGATTPTGSVTFRDGSATLGSVPLSAGVAVLQASSVSSATRMITAVYDGNSNFSGSTSRALSQDIGAAPTATVLETSPTQSILGQPVTLVAKVSALAPGSGVPNGTVTFKDDVAILGTGTLSGGQATLTVAGLAAGSHALRAIYDGTTNFAASGARVGQKIRLVPTTVALSSSPNPTHFRGLIIFTAKVAAAGPATIAAPSGTVTFKDGAQVFATSPVSRGSASFSTASLPAGSHSITAVYEGDSSFAASGSGALPQAVNPLKTAVRLTATPSRVRPGTEMTLTAGILVPGVPDFEAGGAVNFYDGATLLARQAILSGRSVFTTHRLALGKHPITARYAGTAELAASSAIVNVVVDERAGPEFRANSVTANAQLGQSVARTASGFVIVWQSNLQDGSGWGIFGQRYNTVGTRIGPEFRINRTVAGHQTGPRATGLPDGGFVVAWTSDQRGAAGLEILGQRYTAAGAKSGGEFKVNTNAVGSQSHPSGATLANGSFVIAWESDGQDGDGLGVYAQIYDIRGMRSGPEFRVNTGVKGAQSEPSVASLAGGGFAIAWTSDRGGNDGLDVYGQAYNARGAKVGGEVRVNANTAGAQSRPSVAGLKNGGFAVAWQSIVPTTQAVPTATVGAQRFTAAGVKAGATVSSSAPNGQSSPAIAGLPTGGFVVLWTARKDAARGLDVDAQKFDPLGRRDDVVFSVNSTTENNQQQPAVAPLHDGFVAAWTSRGQDTSLEGVYGQRFVVDR